MTISKLFIQLVIALMAAGIATVLVPRRVPGKALGLLMIGLAGVFLGEWAVDLMAQAYNLRFAWLEWEFQDVPILPAVIGSTIVLYLSTFVANAVKLR